MQPICVAVIKIKKSEKFRLNYSDFFHTSDNDFHAFLGADTPFVQKG